MSLEFKHVLTEKHRKQRRVSSRVTIESCIVGTIKKSLRSESSLVNGNL